MNMLTKKVLLTLLLLGGSIQQNHGMCNINIFVNENPSLTRTLLGLTLLSIPGYFLGGKKSNRNEKENKTPEYVQVPILWKTNITKNSMKKVTGTASILASLGLISNNAALLQLACRAPIVGALACITCSKKMNSLLSGLPLGLGEQLSCQDEECDGACNKSCLLPKILITFALYRMLDKTIEHTINLGINLVTKQFGF